MTKNAHRRIAKNIGFVAIFVFLAKVAGALKEIIVAHRFGVAEVVDAYLLVFTLLMWLPMVWTVVLATVYVPLSKRLNPDEVLAFTRELSGLTLILGGSLGLVTALVLPGFVPLIWSEFTAEGQHQLQSMLRGLSPIVIGVFVASLYSAQLLGLEKHSNTLFDGIPSLVLAIVILFATSLQSVNQFIVGSLLGVGLQVFGLALILYRNKALTAVRLGFRSGGWLIFRNAIGIMIASTLIMGLVAPIDLMVAGQLGQGNIAVFGYAQRILLLGMGLGATAVARAILPVLSEMRAQHHDADSLVVRWSVVLALVGVVAALVGWWFAEPVVALLFQRGAFTAADTLQVSNTLRYGLLQLPWYFSGVVLVQYFASRERFRILFYSSLWAVAAKLLVIVWLARWLHVEGIMLSSAIMYLASSLYLVYSMIKDRAIKGA